MLLTPLLLLQGATPPATVSDRLAPLGDTALGFLVVGGALFWSVAALIVLVLCLQVSRERSGAAFLTLVLGVALLGWIAQFPVYPWLLAHPVEVIRWAAVYYVGGIVWASWKFVQYHRRRVRPYLQWRREQLAGFGVARTEELTEEQAYHYQEAATKAGFSLRAMGQVKTVKGYSRDFVFWATYWPFSLLGTLLRFVVRDAFTAIFRGVFAALGTYIRTWLATLYRDVHADRDAVLAKAEAYKARKDGGPDEPGGGPGGGPGGAPTGSGPVAGAGGGATGRTVVVRRGGEVTVHR